MAVLWYLNMLMWCARNYFRWHDKAASGMWRVACYREALITASARRRQPDRLINIKSLWGNELISTRQRDRRIHMTACSYPQMQLQRTDAHMTKCAIECGVRRPFRCEESKLMCLRSRTVMRPSSGDIVWVVWTDAIANPENSTTYSTVYLAKPW